MEDSPGVAAMLVLALTGMVAGTLAGSLAAQTAVAAPAADGRWRVIFGQGCP